MTDNYDDIIHLPHPVSMRHPRMAVKDRAVQFAPFAALTGFEFAIRESARLTDKQIELGEYDHMRLNEVMNRLLECVHERPLVSVAYFKPDKYKEGGSYESLTGKVKRVDEYAQQLVFEDGTLISIASIIDIQFV